MILCGENEGQAGDGPVMTCLHVETEEQVESTKEEIEVWIRMLVNKSAGQIRQSYSSITLAPALSFESVVSKGCTKI